MKPLKLQDMQPLELARKIALCWAAWREDIPVYCAGERNWKHCSFFNDKHSPKLSLDDLKNYVNSDSMAPVRAIFTTHINLWKELPVNAYQLVPGSPAPNVCGVLVGAQATAPSDDKF